MRNSEIRARARTEAGQHFLPLCLLLVLIPALGWLWTLQLAIVMPPWALLAPLIPVACYFFASPVGLYYLEKDRIPVGEVWHHFVTSGRLGVLSNLLLELLWRFTVYLLIAIATSFFVLGKLLALTGTNGLYAVILLIPLTYAIALLGKVYLSFRYLFAPFIAFSTHLNAKAVMVETAAFYRQTFLPLLSLLLSFIGWDILCLLSGGVALIWVLPYKQMALSIFFTHHWNHFSDSKTKRKEQSHA